MRPSVPLLLASAYASGGTLSGSTTATSLLHGSGKANLAGGTLDVGTKLKASLKGYMGVGASVAGTMTFDVRIGGTVITNFTAMQLRTSSCATSPFALDIDLTIQANSTAAAAIATMVFAGFQTLGSTPPSTLASGQACTPVVIGPSTGTNNWDQTANGTLDIFGTWSVSTSGNTITVMQSDLWIMN